MTKYRVVKNHSSTDYNDEPEFKTIAYKILGESYKGQHYFCSRMDIKQSEIKMIPKYDLFESKELALKSKMANKDAR